MKNEKCSEEGHTVKIQQFERVKYIHKGKEKKKIQLIDKHLKLTELCELFKDKLEISLDIVTMLHILLKPMISSLKI